MSTIKVTNIHDTSNNVSLVTDNAGIKTDKLTGNTTAGSISVVGEGNSNTTNLQQGLAKWWVRHNDGSIADSFNNASITDNGTGDFSHGFTNDMRADSAYCVTGIAEDNNSRTAKVTFNTANAETQDGLLRYITGFESGTNGESTALDCNNTNVMIHGDLA